MLCVYHSQQASSHGGANDASTRTVISDFRRDIDELCPLLGYYEAPSRNSVSTFRGNLLVASSRVEKSKKKINFFNPIGCHHAY
jgi:hypothetical protein